jgi:pyrrolysine biosynthesis protein PylD
VTRLVSTDIASIPEQLLDYEQQLRSRIGCGLLGLAGLAVSLEERPLAERLKGTIVAVVPMDSGLGVIEGFAAALQAIAAHLGFTAFVTRHSDVGGLAEAYARDAGILLAADDLDFVAINLRTRRVADNSGCTARGFAAALDRLCGGVRGRPVLVLGCGPVGRQALRALGERGAEVAVHDIKLERAQAAAAELGASGRLVRVEPDLERALLAHELIYDATPAPGFIRERHIGPRSCVSAPGVPLGLDAVALKAIGSRLVHDPLQIGVAVMLAEVLAG